MEPPILLRRSYRAGARSQATSRRRWPSSTLGSTTSTRSSNTRSVGTTRPYFSRRPAWANWTATWPRSDGGWARSSRASHGEPNKPRLSTVEPTNQSLTRAHSFSTPSFRLRNKITVPHDSLASSLQLLTRLRRASSLARRAARFTLLARRLESQMADMGDGSLVPTTTAQTSKAERETRERRERAMAEAALTLAEIGKPQRVTVAEGQAFAGRCCGGSPLVCCVACRVAAASCRGYQWRRLGRLGRPRGGLAHFGPGRGTARDGPRPGRARAGHARDDGHGPVGP